MSKMLCSSHGKRIIQLGSSLNCTHSCQICEMKGCIKNHEQQENVHNIYTVDYVRNIMDKFKKGNENKRIILRQMIHEYFSEAKRQIDAIYT